jgi:multiple sugar transport system substrate-binding protein
MKKIPFILFVSVMNACVASDLIELDLWYNVSSEHEQRIFEAQVQRFNQQMQNVKVNTLVLPQSAFSEFVVQEAKADRLPDILYFQSGSLSRYVWSDLLVPIDGLLESDLLENVTPTIRQQGTYPVDGRVYAVSPTSDALTLYANKGLLIEAGIQVPETIEQSWDTAQFHQALTKLAQQFGKWPLDMQLNSADDDWYLTAFSPFVQATGGDIISKSKWDAHIALDSLFMEDFEDILAPMIKNEWIVPSHKSTKRFEKGRAALAIATTTQWPEFKEALGEQLVAIPFPVLGPYSVTSNDSWSFGVTSQTEYPELAAEFLRFILTDEEVLAVSIESYSVPATYSALAGSRPFGPTGPLHIPAQQLATVARPKPLHPAYPVIREAMADAFDDILAGVKFDVALLNAAEIIDSDIKDNGGYAPFNDM